MFDGIKKAGGISFGVSMVTSQLGKDTTKARKMMGGFVDDTKKRLAGLRNSFSGVAASMTAVFSAAAITGFAKRQFEMIDSLHHSAQSLGVTTEELSRLGWAAEQSGSDITAVEKSMARMVRTTRDAAVGLETAKRSFDVLGLDAKALNQLAPEKQFQAIAEAFSKLKAEQDQLVVAQDIFGRSGKSLIETLSLGKDGLAGMADQADRLGVTINGIDAANVAKAADEMNELRKQMAGIGNQLAIDFGPGVVGLSQRVATGMSRMTGGEGGENVREKMLREKTELAAERASTLQIEAQNRFAARQRAAQMKANPLGLPTREEYFKRKSQGQAVHGAMTGALGMGGDLAKSLGATLAQIASGIANDPVAKAQRDSALASILNRSAMQGGASDSTWSKTRRKASHGIRDFDAVESGSMAAYQQRIRGQQQFNKARPIEEKQLATLEQIAKALENPADHLIAEGAV